MADATTYYAWSTFVAEQDQWGNTKRTINPGDTITRADLKSLNVTDAEWDYLIQSGAIRTAPYPDIPNNVSPAEHLKALVAQNDPAKVMELVQAMSPNVEPGTTAQVETQRVQEEQAKTPTPTSK